MPISPEDVLKVARLAHLELGPADADRLSRQLGAILGYVAQLDELDTSGLSADLDLYRSPLLPRDDVPAPSLPREQVLEQAPATEAGHFRVPPVL